MTTQTTQTAETPPRTPMTTHSKALEINMDPTRYGSFAEIGAGQEVGRWFFRVGGAAGTVAKTMSAYDKKVSDAIYGTAQRYVSSGRLLAMLEYEYALNIERLDQDRGGDTSFFAFADTVSAQNYRGDADCHGWMGVRFQSAPRAQPSQIILHARMIDRDALMQHEALGVLGVNLIYGATRLADQPEVFLASLLDNLGNRRIEIDMVEFSGDAFGEVDHRLMSLRLVEFGLSRAAMFSANGAVLRPSEVLYKSPVLLQRGRFRPPTKVHIDIQRRALDRFGEVRSVDGDRIVSLLELSLREIHEAADGTAEDDGRDFLDRIEALTAVHQSVLVSDCPAYDLVVDFLSHFGVRQIGLPIGIFDFVDLIREDRYEHLAGGFLEAAGRIFGKGVRLYVYPGIDPKTGQRVDLESLEVPRSIAKLLEYLMDSGLICSLEGLPNEDLMRSSDDVLRMIQQGDDAWESHVEPEVGKAIKSAQLFGYSQG
jgi:hypothetical protein